MKEKQKRAIKWGTAGGILTLLSCALLLLLFLFILRAPLFAGGKNYVFYTGNSSSAQQIFSQNPALDKLTLGNIKGESAEYDGNRLQEIVKTFQARLVFCEEACGVKNYYFYSERLSSAVYLNGEAVNLHVALRESSTAVGSPLIFGGY